MVLMAQLQAERDALDLLKARHREYLTAKTERINALRKARELGVSLYDCAWVLQVSTRTVRRWANDPKG